MKRASNPGPAPRHYFSRACAGLGLTGLVLHATGSKEFFEFVFLAFRQQLALSGPLFPLDTAIEFQMVIDPLNFLRRPRRDLVKVEKAKIVQDLFILRANPADSLELVCLATAGCGNAFRPFHFTCAHSRRGSLWRQWCCGVSDFRRCSRG